MTREEAIEVINAYRDKLTNSASNQLDGDIEAFTMAINALLYEKCHFCKHTYEPTLKQFAYYDEVLKEQEPCDFDFSIDFKTSTGRFRFSDGTEKHINMGAYMEMTEVKLAREAYERGKAEALSQEPCDAVSREAALEKMADYVASGYADSVEDFEEYSRIICQLPPVTHKSGKWIPVSERLPEDNGYYLTTTMYNEVYCDYWEEDHFNRTEAVIAWMPLPKPYEPQEGANE